MNIREFAFDGCTALTHLSLYAASFDRNIFRDTALTEVTFGGTKEAWIKLSRSWKAATPTYYDWDAGTGDYIVHCSDGDLTKAEAL